MDKPKRTSSQNDAIHVLFRLIEGELNAKGYTIKFVVDKMKKTADLPWTESAVKELLWKPILKAQTGKTSTTEMDTVSPSDIHKVLMNWLTTNLDEFEYIDFPSNR